MRKHSPPVIGLAQVMCKMVMVICCCQEKPPMFLHEWKWEADMARFCGSCSLTQQCVNKKQVIAVLKSTLCK